MKRILIFLICAVAGFAQTIPAGTAGVFNLAGGSGGGGGSGTVTSVSWTGGIVTVTNPTTTPAFTIAGTSGGIPYFSSTSTWASSSLLAANSLMIGGGAGAAPSTTTTGTGILTFLGTPSSANIASALTDETGTGVAVFSASPAFTGIPTAPTATVGTNTTQIATTAFVLANASGSGTVSSGTTNRLSKYTASTTVGNSLVSDDGTTLTYSGTGGISVTSASTGTVTVTGATSGSTIYTTNAATAQAVTVITAPQTVGAASATLPDLAGTNRNYVMDTTTQTLTNKRVTARVGPTTSSATPTINTDNVDLYSLTAQAVDITSFTTNLSGTPVNGDQLEIRITGTAARAITWGTGFVAGPAALPTTTTTTKTLYVYFEYDSVVTHWVCMFSGSLP